MKIEVGIKALLRDKGIAVIPNLGTFRVSHVSASVQEQGGVIAPPAEIIDFSEETTSLRTASVAEYLQQKGYSAENSQESVSNFVEAVKSHTQAGAKSTVEGLGFFRANDVGDLEFFSEHEMQMASESFGLPKLTARPLVPVVIKPTPPQPASSGLLMKAILVPLVLIALILIFLVFKPDAYNSLASYFSGNGDNELVDEKKKEDLENKEITPIGKADSEANNPKENEVVESNPKEMEVEEDEEDEEVENPNSNDTGATTGGIITSKTNRFYIIIGSFTNDAVAKQAISKANKIGYPGAKILKMDGRTRVSVDDYSTRDNAVGKAKRVGKDFPGAWVLAN